MSSIKQLLPVLLFIVVMTCIKLQIVSLLLEQKEAAKTPQPLLNSSVPSQDISVGSRILPQRFMERRQHLISFCQKRSDSFKRLSNKWYSRFLLLSQYNLSYCKTNRVGSTTWMLHFVELSDPEDPLNEIIFTNASYRLHERLNRRYGIYNKSLKSIERLNSSLMFTFVRHPFLRLVSGYVHNVVDVNYKNWRQRILHMSKRFNYSNGFGIRLCETCPSFGEFVDYFIQGFRDLRADPHLALFLTSCNMCSFDFDIIGKLETFSADAHAIFSMIGQAHKYSSIRMNPTLKDDRHLKRTNKKRNNGEEDKNEREYSNELTTPKTLESTTTESATSKSKKFYNFALQLFSTLSVKQVKRLRSIYRFDLDAFNYGVKDFFSVARKDE